MFSEGWKLLSREATLAMFLSTECLKVGTGEEPVRNCEAVPFHPTPVILNRLIRMKTASDKLLFKKSLYRRGEAAALKQFYLHCYMFSPVSF